MSNLVILLYGSMLVITMGAFFYCLSSVLALAGFWMLRRWARVTTSHDKVFLAALGCMVIGQIVAVVMQIVVSNYTVLIPIEYPVHYGDGHF